LVNEIATTQKKLKAISKGDMSPKKDELLYYEELNSSTQVGKIFRLFSRKIQIIVTENKSLKETTGKLAKHNDYLAENLERLL
jgi:hypothetical protein